MSDLCNRLTYWLLGCCGILALVIALELSFPVSVTTTASTPAGKATLPELPQSERFVPPTLAAYAATLERPIFFQTRKMPEPPAAPSAPPTPLRLRLEGVAVSGDTRIAVLRSLKDNQLLQLTRGSSHEGWRLISVDSDSATFDRDGQVTLLELEISDKRRH